MGALALGEVTAGPIRPYYLNWYAFNNLNFYNLKYILKIYSPWEPHYPGALAEATNTFPVRRLSGGEVMWHSENGSLGIHLTSWKLSLLATGIIWGAPQRRGPVWGSSDDNLLQISPLSLSPSEEDCQTFPCYTNCLEQFSSGSAQRYRNAESLSASPLTSPLLEETARNR